MQVHCYLVTYDISSPKRWRRVYRTLQGFGEHVQLSVFRCDLTRERHVRLKMAIEKAIHHEEDQVVLVKLGPSTTEVIDGIEVLRRSHRFDPPSPTII